MKIPNIFRPEKILEEKIKNLESIKEKELEVKSLTDFILNEGPYAKYAFSSEIHKLTYERLYSSISKTDVIDGIYIGYSSSGDKFTPTLDLLKFQDAQTMRNNINNMTECARKLNVNNSLKVCVIVKGSYACFVYTSDSDQEWIVDTYKEKFGFKEIGQ
jgi:hypothetical protein